MRSRLLMVLTVVAALSVTMAAPASATEELQHRHPFGGDQVMVLNEKPEGGFGQYGCEDISWWGTVELYGRTYGMALYSMGGYVGDDGLFHYEEGWKIFRNQFKLKDGLLKRCEPGKVLASGVDQGVWLPETGEFESYGTVDYAGWRFWRWQGRSVIQTGVTEPISVFGLEDVLGFYGSLRLS